MKYFGNLPDGFHWECNQASEDCRGEVVSALCLQIFKKIFWEGKNCQKTREQNEKNEKNEKRKPKKITYAPCLQKENFEQGTKDSSSLSLRY